MATKQTQTKQTVCIRNLPAAAAMLTVGHRLIEVNPAANNRFEFVLQGYDVDTDAAKFLTGTLQGSLSVYMTNFDLLRTSMIRIKGRRAGDLRTA